MKKIVSYTQTQKKNIKFLMYSIIPVIAGLFFTGTSHAQLLDGVDKKTAEKLKENFEKNVQVPKENIDYIGKTEFPGIYMILANGYKLPVYSDINLNKMFVGNYIDNTRNKANIVEEIKEKNYRIEPKKFLGQNANNAIVAKKGSGINKMYLFADANCGYCKKLETEVLEKINDVTIYTIPISILRPGGEMDKKVKNLLCKPEDQQNKLWLETMSNNGGDSSEVSCAKASVLEKNTETSKKLGVSGTPTIVFPNGTVSVGFIELNELQTKLVKNQK